MATELIELRIAENLAALTDEALQYTPASGKKVKVRSFVSGGEDSQNLINRIYWKHGQAGELLIWSMDHGSEMPFVFDVPDADINGTNRIGIVVDNNGVSSVYASLYALIEVSD